MGTPFFHNLPYGVWRNGLLPARGIFAFFIGAIVFTSSLKADQAFDNQPEPRAAILATSEERSLSPVDASNIKLGEVNIPSNGSWNDIRDYLTQHERLSEADANQAASEVLMLFQTMRQKGRDLEQKIPLADFEERLERSGLTHADPDTGRAKVTKADGVKWIKVVHKKSKTAFLFLNEEKIHPSSRHLHLIISNMHFNAGKHIKPEELPEEWMQKARKKGALFGRDVVVIWYHEKVPNPDDSPYVTRVEAYARPTPKTDLYKYEYKLACDKKFSRDNMLWNGTVMGTLQVGVLMGLHYLTPHIPFFGGHTEPLHPILLAVTFVYSHYAGGYLAPKLRAKSQRLTHNQRFWLRGLTISLPYALMYKALTVWGQANQSWEDGIRPFAVLLAAQAVNIAFNFFINNRVSSGLLEHTQLDDEGRSITGLLKWPSKIGMKVKRIDARAQIRYLAVSFSSRTIDLNDNFRGINIPIPFLGEVYHLSSGKLLYLLLPPVILYNVMKRAERENAPSAPVYRERWNRSLTGRVVNAIKPSSKSMKLLCVEALSRLR